MKKTPLKKKSKNPISKAKAEAWKVFSEWVRRNGEDRDGFNECYTCRQRIHWKRLQAGHFIPRTHNSTFINEMNVKPQCFADNIWKRGASHEFSARLIKEYGLEEFNKLIELGRQIKQFSLKELEDIKKKYEELL